MCSCDWGDGPSAFSQKIRRARIAHVCYECGRAILAGTRYRFISGVWEGRGDSFKLCLRCARMHDAHHAAEASMGETGCWAPYGNLLETIQECMLDEFPYRAALRVALRRGAHE